MSFLVQPAMSPEPGERLQRFIGDRIRFSINSGSGQPPQKGWRALLRTNLGRAAILRREILESHTRGLPLAGGSWRDIPMTPGLDGWSLELSLVETGFFRAKAYLLDPGGWQHWPGGPDVGISVHPDFCRTANTIYCAFTRLFGKSRYEVKTTPSVRLRAMEGLEEQGYTIIPDSGKLRDLAALLPHIKDRLGCRILQLLPINPTPTTYARFGRYGSPYAALDLTAIDPALVVFDKRTTGADQFRELTYSAHRAGMRVLLDIVINHTGWGSVLQEKHPEWFVRKPAGEFVSPGAWGVTWEDLVELKHDNVELWDDLAQIFLTWCRRGVDGFRCDAGYMVPVPAWQYIVARVQVEYPDALFLLEGLGGAWEATSQLLGEGGMQWAYSELFQNYSPQQISGYLDHHLRQAERTGLLVHYSETHDNERLAKQGRDWSLLRNRLSALTSISGGFAFTSGVEWLATQKINVHQCTGLAWDNQENIVEELRVLNRLLANHPAFFDGARVQRLSSNDSQVLLLHRVSAEGKDEVLICVNTDQLHPQEIEVVQGRAGFSVATQPQTTPSLAVDPVPFDAWVDLLGQRSPKVHQQNGCYRINLDPGTAYCFAPSPATQGLAGDEYRQARARATWAYKALQAVGLGEDGGFGSWQNLAALVGESPVQFLSAVTNLSQVSGSKRGIEELTALMSRGRARTAFPFVVTWNLIDCRRITPVPPDHWLYVEESTSFRATLSRTDGSPAQNIESTQVGESHMGFFPPQVPGSAQLLLERYTERDPHMRAQILFLDRSPEDALLRGSEGQLAHLPNPSDLALLTNGRGAMARLCVDLGRITSKYDCVLGANLHPEFPVDRHIFAKRLRAWVSADGFISPLDYRALVSFSYGPPVVWDFVANAGDGRTVQIRLQADMLEEKNTVQFTFSRPTAERAAGKQLPAAADVRLTIRVDVEDRSFHAETKRNPGADHHFQTHTRGLTPDPEDARGLVGFAFTPANDRRLYVYSDSGCYYPAPEWSHNIPHPIEATRGQVDAGDAYSPGWFELPLPKGASLNFIVSAEAPTPVRPDTVRSSKRINAPGPTSTAQDLFGTELLRATRAFVVKRGSGKTIIAGYPWFLDWGRDTFIAARGLLTAGMVEEVCQLLVTFSRFVDRGTLPNTIFGEDASNRDTSDAPLWFAVVCEELASLKGPEIYQLKSPNGRTLESALRDIAAHYASATPNGIRMDPASGLIWSPSHFTWMDTNYPAGTPRQGYPVEIQALWWRLLRQMSALGRRSNEPDWALLANQVKASIRQQFWSKDLGYYSDLLIAAPGQKASDASKDDALRSNCLFLVSLGVIDDESARACVDAVRRHLVIPGALRSLAPLRVKLPLPIYHHGHLLNNPSEPYWGHYEGDEDTRRKPAYHNGTGWTWTFPVFCEALARAWSYSVPSVRAARSYLASMAPFLRQGCLGHIPENVDGDAPHQSRGCDAQAWSATEALRVWTLLNSL